MKDLAAARVDGQEPEALPVGVKPPQEPGRTRWVVTLFAAALGYLVLYGSLLAVLYAGPQVGTGLAAEHAVIRSYLVEPFSDRGDDLGFLSSKERSHLHDVKLLFDVASALGGVALGWLIGATVALRVRKHRVRCPVGRALWSAAVSTAALLLVLGLGAWLDFHRFWEILHRVLFPQGGWLFATDSTLIQIYPLSYFQGFVLRWVIIVVSASVLLAVLGRRVVAADQDRS